MPKIKQILSLPNATEIVNFPDKDLQTVMFHAGIHEDEDFGLEVMNMLLDKGADPFHKEENKESIIYYLAASSTFPSYLHRQSQNPIKDA